jgi:hypothetical protein
MSTTTATPRITKGLFIDALAVYRNACDTGEEMLADAITVEYLLEFGINPSDAHMALAGIGCVVEYDLTVS